MGYIKGKDRYQQTFLPPVIDDYVSEDSEVRIIDAFVNGLEIKFQYSDIKGRGNEPYDPKDMTKIYVFCSMKGIRSSRKIERECSENLSLIWLTGGLTPDDRTICDFRKNNKEQLYQVLKEFIAVCKKTDLFSTELAAVDGSKFRASNAKNKIYTRKQIKEKLESIDRYVEKYLNEIDENDKEEMKIKRVSGEKVQEIIKELQEKRNKYDKLQKELENSTDKQISLTDKDCRLMHKRNGEVNAGYNVQLSADAKSNMIIDIDVTNHANDQQELSNIAKKTKETLGLDKLTVIADGGYENRAEFEECRENGIIPIVSISKTAKGNSTYSKDEFAYNKEEDVYICPNKRKLYYLKQKIQTKGKRKLKYRVYADKEKCINCEFREQCFKNQKGYRKIERWEKETEIIDRMKTDEAKEILKKRQGIIEHPIGTIKRTLNFEYFLTRGLESVKAEFSLAALAYNIRRALNILGFNKLMNLLKPC